MSTLIIIIFSHWIADFVCQSDYMAKNKSKSWSALSLHILSYTGMLALLLFFKFDFNAIGYALINGALHFIVDAITSRITSYLYSQNRVHDFFVVIGLDQAIHMSILVLTIPILIN